MLSDNSYYEFDTSLSLITSVFYLLFFFFSFFSVIYSLSTSSFNPSTLIIFSELSTSPSTFSYSPKNHLCARISSNFSLFSGSVTKIFCIRFFIPEPTNLGILKLPSRIFLYRIAVFGSSNGK